jgi:predicted RNA-binding protein with PIN domain
LERLIVDGYNVIHAWEDLRRLLDVSLEAARDALIGRLATYGSVRGADVTVVFDAQRAPELKDDIELRDGVRVIFARRSRSADHAIERIAYLARETNDPVVVATSDRLHRDMLRGMAAAVIGAKELEVWVQEAEDDLRRQVKRYTR